MGYYIDPTNGQTKEEWLTEHGIRLMGVPETIDEGGEDLLPVCLVNNGAFNAAGIAFSNAELRVFASPRDTRPKVWYLVEKKDLFEVQPNVEAMVT